MSLMRVQAVRRWAVVAVGLALLCGLPVIASALPVSVPQLTASQLRGRILASAGESYAGYAESNATFGLPSLTGFSGLTSLFDGVTKMRVWRATATRWRVDVLSDAGEQDTYQLGSSTYLWDSGEQLLTEVLGAQPVRLPRAADLVPPTLAARVLAEAGPQARFSLLTPVRVAGQSAAGLRITPADPASTVGQVDIWAAPASGLPLMVEIFGRGSGRPALETQFFQVSPWRPDPRVLTPVRGPGTGFTTTRASTLPGALRNLVLTTLPARLAGRVRLPVQPGFSSIGVYGGGLATFVVVGVRGDAGRTLISDARSDGGAALSLSSGASGVLISAPLVNAVLVRPARAAHRCVTFLIAGTVSPQVLEQAANSVVTQRSTRP
jgi:hypothetical protein